MIGMIDVLWKLYCESPYSRHTIDFEVGAPLEELPPIIVEAAQELNLDPAEVTRLCVEAAKERISNLYHERSQPR